MCIRSQHPDASVIPTYVIAVDNPVTDEDPNPPNVVGALDELAVAGGTEEAFITNTDDVEQTINDLGDTLATIRAATTSCEVVLEGALDADRVELRYTSPSVGEVTLDHDPTCAATNAWRFDDEQNPRAVVLCEAICESIRDGAGTGELTSADGCL